MVKAVLIEFYGTIVHEDGEVIKKISQEIFDTGNVEDQSEIGHIGGMNFRRAFFLLMGIILKNREYWSINH